MKQISLFLFLLCFVMAGTSTITSANTSDNPWKIIEEQNINGVSTRLKLREKPTLNVQDWISIEFKNNTQKALLIENAFYAIDCKVYHKKNGKLIKQGRIASRSASELLDKSLDSPFPMIDLAPGINISSKYPSVIGAVLFSVPEQKEVIVEATLKLFIQLKGPDSFAFNWEEIPFTFEWSRPDPLEFSDLYQRLNYLLENPVYSSLHHYELLALLSVSEISKGIAVQTLIEGLKKRTDKQDGRLAILYHLNDHFSQDKLVLDYYLELLKNNDLRALEELSTASDIWDDRFLEPLIAQYQKLNIGTMHRVMEVMYVHQNSWIKKEGISAILSDIILYQYETIIYEDPRDLTTRQLRTASLLIDILGKTGNKEVIPVICPFLDEDAQIFDSGLVLDPTSMELPRPMRICDNALEALMRLNNIDLIKTYKKQKYQPPYEYGEAEIIISKIRDQLIKDFQKRGQTCR